jgi:hypothetical protein
MVDSDNCDPEVYKHGAHVFTLADLSTKEINAWVEKVSKESGQKVDWHFVGGRACIRCLGNIKKVVAAINNNLSDITSKTKYWRFTTENDHVLPVMGG